MRLNSSAVQTIGGVVSDLSDGSANPMSCLLDLLKVV